VALRAAIVALLRDAARRAEMSINCRRIAVEEYTLEAQARRYIELYERAVAKPEKVTESLHDGVLRR
jgi:glycosyltransferase involved in cell wall biosynthesis